MNSVGILKFVFSAFVLLTLSFHTFGQKSSSIYPDVIVNIALHKDTLLSSNDIKVVVKLTNNSGKVQKLLFDNPQIVTPGPWSTLAEVIDLRTGKSVLKVKNKALLSSTIYFEDQLKDKYIYLPVGKSVSKKYSLSNIVVINWDYSSLPKGEYELQLFYSGWSSNKVRFYII